MGDDGGGDILTDGQLTRSHQTQIIVLNRGLYGWEGGG
jgi:hypothetical protein